MIYLWISFLPPLLLFHSFYFYWKSFRQICKLVFLASENMLSKGPGGWIIPPCAFSDLPHSSTEPGVIITRRRMYYWSNKTTYFNELCKDSLQQDYAFEFSLAYTIHNSLFKVLYFQEWYLSVELTKRELTRISVKQVNKYTF